MLETLTLSAFWKVVALVGAGGLIAVAALAVAYFVPPLRKIAVHVAIIAGAFTFIYAWGAADQRAICAAREKAAEEAATQRDTDQGKESHKDILARLLELEQQTKEDQEKLSAYEKALRDRAGGACALTPDDLPPRLRPH